MLGLALEEHSRAGECTRCNRPATLEEWVAQQNFRGTFLHYISLLHAMAVTSLSGATKPRFQVCPPPGFVHKFSCVKCIMLCHSSSPT